MWHARACLSPYHVHVHTVLRYGVGKLPNCVTEESNPLFVKLLKLLRTGKKWGAIKQGNIQDEANCWKGLELCVRVCACACLRTHVHTYTYVCVLYLWCVQRVCLSVCVRVKGTSKADSPFPHLTQQLHLPLPILSSFL